MFKNVGDAGGVGGDGVEGNRKGLVVVGVLDGQQRTAQHLVLEKVDVRVDFPDVGVFLEDKARVGVSWLKVHMVVLAGGESDGVV